MNIGLLNIMHNKVWDFRPDLAQTYADALKNAIELHLPNDIEKQHGYFLSKKGYQKDGKTVGANFEDKLYVGDIHRIERHLYWNDEELQEDDEIINVVVVDGPVTRDGDGCSYGTKDFRDQVMYANTIPQVVGHLFLINTPGGQASCRNDYEMMIADCREKGKPTVAFVDGMCCSSGVNLACRCDRVIVMNAKDEFGCIGTMAAFWAVAHDTVDQDGYRYVELVGKDCPEKNDWYREAAAGEYEKLQAELDKDTEEFHNEVRENRPLVTADMLTGKVFEAQEVIPALVDEIGDMNRAIECVFELANETLTAARLVTAEPKNEPASEPAPGEEPEEKKQEIDFNPINDKNMPEEKKKAAEAAEEQQAAEQVEQPAAEAAAEEAPATEAPAASEEAPAQEGTEAPAEEAPAQEEEKPAEEEEKPAEEAPANEEEQPASDETIENAEAELDKIQETLHNAEQMIADKDKEIADLKESLATLKGIADERDAAVQESNDIHVAHDKLELDYAEQGKQLADAEAKIAEHVATIETLKKQVSDLKAEVKELAGKPAPMTDAAAGIPQDNGTGEAPKQTGSGITSEMSYEEVRAQVKKAAAEKAAKKKGE